MPAFIHNMPILAAALLLSSASGLAMGQNALGDGRALDANPGQYGPNNYQRPSLVDELRFRNAIATGNAPGGLSFRGDIGYRAPGEFTGQLGSDALFAFRRDSLYSGLAGMGIRGTDALQYQFALTTGAAPPRNLIGNLSYTRDDLYSGGYSSQQPTAHTDPSIGSTQVIGFDNQVDDLDLRGQALSVMPAPYEGGSSMLGTLRSPSTYTTTSSLQPSLMSVYEQGLDRRQYGLVSSPLLGVTSTPLTEEERPGNPLVARPANADLDPRTPGGMPPTRITTSYDELIQQMRERVETRRSDTAADRSISYDPDETNDEWLIRQINELRQQLYGNTTNQRTQPDQPTDRPGDQPADEQDGATDQQGTDRQGTGQGEDDDALSNLPPVVPIPDNSDSPLTRAIEEKRGGLRRDEGVQLYNPTEIAIDRETLEVLRGNAANEVEQLLDPDAADRDIYAEHITRGQRLIRDGRYFDAEERFTHALSIKPRDIPAQLGRLHAQIGAGMLLSASVNLQSLFTAHPEIIASKYADDLLPSGERLDELLARLRERSGIERPERSARPLEGDRVRVSAAMLLAYIGYQTEDERAIEEGLALVHELGTDSDRRFVSVLSQIWDVDAPVGTDDQTDEQAGEQSAPGATPERD